MLQKGDLLPDISLKDQNNQDIKLKDYIGSPLIIFFYPKDNTKVCTAQACGFRDHFEEYLKLDTTIFGISKDAPESHAKVIKKRSLPFSLLSDSNGKAAKAFGVKTYLFGTLTARCTFVIDKEGRVQNSFRDDFNADHHIAKSLKTLSALG